MKFIFIFLFMLIPLSGCKDSVGNPSYLFKPAKEGVAAKIGEEEISMKELHNGIEADIFEAESKLFEIKFNKLKTMVLQKFIDKDPRKGSLSNDEFLEKYILKKIEIGEKEISAFITEQNIPSEHINPQVKEKIKDYLESEKKKTLVEKWLREQMGKTSVEVYLAKPRRPVFPVEVGSAPITGGQSAKVTIVEFSDFQCPYCAKGADILKNLKNKYGNKIKVAFKNFPLPFHQHAEQASLAGLCAHEQKPDFFWKMHDEMFSRQDELDLEGLKKIGKKVGVNVEALEKCLQEKKYLGQINSDIEEGKKINVRSTPTFFVNGQLINGAQPVEVFSELIDEALSK